MPYTFPDTTEETATFKPSCEVEDSEEYKAPIVRPPTIAENDKGTASLEAFLDYSKGIKNEHSKKLSPRHKAQIKEVASICHKAINAPSGKERRQLMILAKIHSNGLASRWDTLHSEKTGAARALHYANKAVTETRMFTHYGDYYAEFCKRLRGPGMSTFQWQERIGERPRFSDWRQIWAEIKPQLERRMVEEEKNTKPRTRSQWLDDLDAAAKLINQPTKVVIHAIRTYAHRNSICHRGIEDDRIAQNWGTLAHKIEKDKKLLDKVYKQSGRNDEKDLVKAVIEDYQRQHFRYLKSSAPGQYCEHDKYRSMQDMINAYD